MPLIITVPDPGPLQEAMLAAVADDGDTMKAISFDLFDIVDARLAAGSFTPPLKPETIERKRREGYPAKALTKTGAARRHLRRKYSRKGHSATVKRGKEETYMFFHQYGAGRNEKREWMFLEEGEKSGIFGTYVTDLDKRLETLNGKSFD